MNLKFIFVLSWKGFYSYKGRGRFYFLLIVSIVKIWKKYKDLRLVGLVSIGIILLLGLFFGRINLCSLYWGLL